MGKKDGFGKFLGRIFATRTSGRQRDQLKAPHCETCGCLKREPIAGLFQTEYLPHAFRNRTGIRHRLKHVTGPLSNSIDGGRGDPFFPRSRVDRATCAGPVEKEARRICWCFNSFKCQSKPHQGETVGLFLLLAHQSKLSVRPTTTAPSPENDCGNKPDFPTTKSGSLCLETHSTSRLQAYQYSPAFCSHHAARPQGEPG